jgi:glutathione S-transferase/GST-like protein
MTEKHSSNRKIDLSPISIELYHWEPAGDSLKVLICLHEKGQEFRSHYIDILDFAQFRPEFLKLATFGQVPVLAYNGAVFSEPRLLLEYLEDAFPRPALAPADAAGWYDVQEWIRYADTQLGATVNLIGWHCVMLPAMSAAEQKAFNERLANVPVQEQQAGWAAVVRDAESTENRIENARGKIREAMDRIESTLAKSSWLVGDAYSLADINAFAWINALPKLMPGEVNAAKTPKILAWLRTIAERPAVRKALAMTRRASDQGNFPPL